MKYYVDQTGGYLGGWDANPPAGAVEAPFAPSDARQVWSFETESWSEIPQYVPSKVTMRQARLALLAAGLLDDVESLLQNMEGTEGQAARIEWDYSSEVHRHKPFVMTLGSQLGLNDEQLDALFITASQID